MLTEEQLREYDRDGFLVLRGAISEADLTRFDAGVARNPPIDQTLNVDGLWPAPGRYTLAHSALKDPDLATIAEHAAPVSAAKDALRSDDVNLTAFVVYDRTPGGPSIGSHNDYKRWRPVGSSMNWLFTIMPFCDFDAAAGPLYVSPGSHRTDRVAPGAERPLECAPPARPDESTFIDPELRRGDLLLMNMHLWHKADGNNSDHHRIGAFNKYAASDAPPATGYYLFDDDAYLALSPENRALLAVHGDKPIASTRLLLTRERADEHQVLVIKTENGTWGLPGGPTWTEQAIPDWDVGNYIAALQSSLRDQLRIETPWVSYVGDFDESDHLCRVYAYTLTGQGFPVPYDGEWVSSDQLDARRDSLANGWEPEALAAWLDPSIVRGKGVTQSQARVDQYAY